MIAIAATARVAFQGERGAFSEDAALSLLGPAIVPVPCMSFAEAYAAVPDGRADYLLAPVRNTIAGRIHASCDLYAESKLFEVGKFRQRIALCLIALPGVAFGDLASVASHPAALLQCRRFLAANPQLRAVAAADTAGSVRELAACANRTGAAIASARAAELYDAVVLRAHIEDHAANFTDFLLLGA